MEKKFLSGLSLFDFLAMVIPGGLFLAILGNCTGYIPFVIDETQYNKFFIYTIILITSYLVGIIHNQLIELITITCRNNPKCTTSALIQIARKTRQQYLSTLQMLPINKYHFASSPQKKHCFCCFFTCKKKMSQETRIYLKSKYYEAYYYVATHSINSSISVMESQVAFMRNMFVPVLIITICLKSYFPEFGDNCCIKFICIIFCITLPIATCCRQNKIYKRVWEDYIYLKYLEQENIKRNKL